MYLFRIKQAFHGFHKVIYFVGIVWIATFLFIVPIFYYTLCEHGRKFITFLAQQYINIDFTKLLKNSRGFICVQHLNAYFDICIQKRFKYY